MAYKLAKEEKDHYLVQHPDGSHFKVAKEPLSEDAHKKIKMYFGGGMVEVDGYADGGEVDPDVQQEMQMDQEVSSPESAEHLMTASPAAAPKPQSTVLEESLPEYEQAFNEQKAGALVGAEGAAKEGAETARAIEQAVHGPLGLEDLRRESDSRQMDLQRDSDTFKQAIARGEIDPRRLYHNMGTGEKIATAIGLVLGGLGAAGTGGRNLVAEHLDQLVAQDVEAQKANMQNKQNLFRLNLEQSGDERQATLTTQRQLLDSVQLEAQAAAARAMDPKAKANALGLVGQIDLQKAGIDNQLRIYQMQAQMASRPFDKAAIPLASPDQQKRAVILPDGQNAIIAVDEKAANEARTAINNTQPLLDTLSQIEKIRSSILPIGEKAEQVRSLIPSALLQLKQAQKLGRLSPEAMKLLESEFSDPTKLVDALKGPGKTRTLKNTLLNQLNTVLQTASPGFRNPASIPGARPKYGR